MTKDFVGGRIWRLVLHDFNREQLEQQETHATMLSNLSIFADWGLIRYEECTKLTLWRVRCLQMQRQDLWLIQIRFIVWAQAKEATLTIQPFMSHSKKQQIGKGGFVI